MKYKTTKKDVIDGYFKVYKIGYCEAQYLLYYKNPIAYTSGVYGWNANIFDFGNIAICTGYRPFGIDVDYNIVRKFDKKASEIVNNWDYKYDYKKTIVNNLLSEFIEIITGVKK